MTRNDAKSFIAQTRLLYIALIVGQLLFAAVLLFAGSSIATVSAEPDPLYAFVAGAASLGSIAASYAAYNLLRRQAQQHADVAQKATAYRSAALVRWAILEGGNLLVLVMVLMSGQRLLFGLFALGMAAFAMARPSLAVFARDYGLSRSEAAELGL